MPTHITHRSVAGTRTARLPVERVAIGFTLRGGRGADYFSVPALTPKPRSQADFHNLFASKELRRRTGPGGGTWLPPAQATVRPPKVLLPKELRRRGGQE